MIIVKCDKCGKMVNCIANCWDSQWDREEDIEVREIPELNYETIELCDKCYEEYKQGKEKFVKEWLRIEKH